MHAVTDAKGRPLWFNMTVGQISDYTGAVAPLSNLAAAEMADRRSGLTRQPGAIGPSPLARADWFRQALKEKGIRPCIPGRNSRGKAVLRDKRRYKRRNRIEIVFGRLKDWRRIATRND